jgi:hypothetical protein
MTAIAVDAVFKVWHLSVLCIFKHSVTESTVAFLTSSVFRLGMIKLVRGLSTKLRYIKHLNLPVNHQFLSIASPHGQACHLLASDGYSCTNCISQARTNCISVHLLAMKNIKVQGLILPSLSVLHWILEKRLEQVREESR